MILPGRYLVAECDDCGDTSEGETPHFQRDDFRDFISALKSAGWTIRKDEDGEIWLHFCPDCGE